MAAATTRPVRLANIYAVMTKLIFGCGYLGERVAQRWLDAGQRVAVVTRRAERAAELAQRGITAIVADILQSATLDNLPAAETVLFSVGFDKTAGQTIGAVYAGGIRNVLAALLPQDARFIYISTTGVYGSAGGGWVDEQTPPDPQRDGGRASLAAEQHLADHPLGARAVVLRMGGLYGPGRVPFLDKLRCGEPIPAPPQGYLNLIHVDDAAAAVVAADCCELPGNGPHVFCVTDGHAVPRREYYDEVARLLGTPPPRFVDPDPASPRAARAASNRRVRNERMLAKLQVPLTYPDYRGGLAAILAR